jgi:hypothetical protein
VPFTPATDVTVTELQAAVSWDGFNPTNKVAMSLAQDSGGLPGTTIQAFHVSNLPVFGDCCGLAVAKHPAGIPLSAGTQYWLVVGTDARSKFEGGWAFNSSDMRFYDYAQNFGGSWGTITFIQPAYAVLGK